MCKYRTIEELIAHCTIVKEYTDFSIEILPGQVILTEEYYNRDNYNRNSLSQVYLTLQPSRWRIEVY